MAKWVTFYEDMFSGISDLIVHENKEVATKYFQKHYKSYFQLSQNMKIELPMSYGYPTRKFKGMTKSMFEKNYGDIVKVKEN